MNGCAPGLALIGRLKATRKWAIDCIWAILKNIRLSLFKLISICIGMKMPFIMLRGHPAWFLCGCEFAFKDRPL